MFSQPSLKDAILEYALKQNTLFSYLYLKCLLLELSISGKEGQIRIKGCYAKYWVLVTILKLTALLCGSFLNNGNLFKHFFGNDHKAFARLSEACQLGFVINIY